jgi:23S rRNA (adenine2503-C2)-methyltransferase
MNSLLDHTPEELRARFADRGIERFRADQVLHWVLVRGVDDFGAMTNLSRDLRSALTDDWQVRPLERVAVHAAGDGTRKLVLRTADGALIEAVTIPEERRQTVCVSAQVGCSLDCSFCATGRLGFGRNLEPGEIVDQLLHAREVLAESALTPAPTNVVFMGMGEPLLNLKNVIGAIRTLTHPSGFGISPRRITVSTAGVASRMAELGAAVPVRLAVSLHATTDAVRDRLVPLNKRFPIAALVEACARYPVARRDRISFEYTLMRDVNDSLEDARRLAQLARKARAKVNLIPLNEHPGTPFRCPEDARVEAFTEAVAACGVTATVRRPRGSDIYAACGQLGTLGDKGRGPSSPGSGR